MTEPLIAEQMRHDYTAMTDRFLREAGAKDSQLLTIAYELYRQLVTVLVLYHGGDRQRACHHVKTMAAYELHQEDKNL